MREAAEGIRARFGFGGEVEKPVPLEEVELRAARLKAPERFGDLFSDGRYERVSHALGKAYRDVVRGFRGEFENPPDLVAFPRDESEIETVLSWAEAEGAAVIPFGGGTSVVGGVEPRLGERPVVTMDLRRLDRVLEVDPESLAARIQAGATGPGAGGAAARARPHPAPLPAVVRVRDARRLDRDPGRRPLRDAGDPHRRPGRVGAGDHPARRPGRAGGCRARAPAPRPDRMLVGSEGILGVIAEAWVRVRPRPEFKASRGVEFDDFLAAAPRRSARSPSPACTPPTAACSTPPRRS